MNCKVCGNTSAKNSSVSFFRFPKENTKCREWAERCDLLALFEKHGTARFYKSFRVCSDHFEPKDVVFDGRKKRLLQSAVPRISLSRKNSEEEKPGNMKKFEQNKIFKLVENLCRLCAEENKNLTDIYGWRGRILKLEDKLKYLPLVISEYDLLPLRVCYLCMCKVNQFHDFILRCMKAETKLRVMCNLEDYNMSYKLIESSDECQEKLNCNTGMSLNFNKTPNLDLPDSHDMMTSFKENPEDDFYDQSFQDNFINEHGENCFCKQSEPDFSGTHQLTNHTNFIREPELSINSFRYDYSTNIESSNQFQKEAKTQTETDQVVEETKQSCDIFLKFFPNTVISNAQPVTNSIQSSSSTELFCEPSQNAFFTRPEMKISDESDEKTHLGCFQKSEKQKSNLVCDINQGNPGNKNKFEKRRCQFCDRLFKNHQLCLAHEKTHEGKTPYECKQCGKKFRSRPSLRQHRSVHSDKRVHSCHECGMSFKRKETLSNHLRIHTGERPFVCKVCGFAFKQRGDCAKHEKNHQKTCKSQVKEENSEMLDNEEAT